MHVARGRQACPGAHNRPHTDSPSRRARRCGRHGGGRPTPGRRGAGRARWRRRGMRTACCVQMRVRERRGGCRKWRLSGGVAFCGQNVGLVKKASAPARSRPRSFVCATPSVPHTHTPRMATHPPTPGSTAVTPPALHTLPPPPTLASPPDGATAPGETWTVLERKVSVRDRRFCGWAGSRDRGKAHKPACPPVQVSTADADTDSLYSLTRRWVRGDGAPAGPPTPAPPTPAVARTARPGLPPAALAPVTRPSPPPVEVAGDGALVEVRFGCWCFFVLFFTHTHCYLIKNLSSPPFFQQALLRSHRARWAADRAARAAAWDAERRRCVGSGP